MNLAAALLVAALQAAAPGARWAAANPILVWIDPAGQPFNGAVLVERALARWSEAVPGRLKLTRTTTKTDAAIRIRFASATGVYGETAPRVDPRSGAIVSADIVIATDTAPDASVNQQIVVYLTALHELGHAIGLRHTDTFADIMYRFQRPDDGERYFGAYRRRLTTVSAIGSPQASGLSADDLTAVRRLYDR